MKNIFYKILPVCLLAACLAGCQDETQYLPLAEAVPLTMQVNDKSFAMGERLVVDIAVNPDEDGNTVVANEDFDIYFTAKSGTDDVSDVFENFHGIVTFPKGEKNIQIDFPVKETGLSGSKSFDFVAFARGYKLANSSQTIKVSDYYRVTMGVENNTENVVTEGDQFRLVANIDKPRVIPIVVKIQPKEGDEASFENLPSTLTIPAGEMTVKSSVVTLAMDGIATGDKTLTLNLVSESPANPMKSDQLVITMTDLESLADPDMYDPTKVYINPDYPFISSKNKSRFDTWWTGASTPIEKDAPHPNATLAAEGWKFWNAVEFHFIQNTFGWSMPKPNEFGNYYPWPFSDVNTKPMQTVQAVNNKQCSTVTEEGTLKMWAQKGPVTGTGADTSVKDYGTFAYQTAKGGTGGATRFIRINPGMRIEVRARLTGNRIGFTPIIELRNISNGVYHTDAQEIDLLRNTKGNFVNQRVYSTTEDGATTNAIPQLGKWNIFWVELIDADNIKVGINGVTTVTAIKTDAWKFDNGEDGLALVMYFAPSDRPAGWDLDLKSISSPKTDEKTPMLEVDWVRFYVNDNYVDLGKYWVNTNANFFY